MNFKNSSHRRKNILTGEWILVSPHRTNRPWQGKKDKPQKLLSLDYDPNCYLCPGNKRAAGKKNPNYTGTYSFINDFSALKKVKINDAYSDGLLRAKIEYGICKVICYSPKHNSSISLLELNEIVEIIKLWQNEYSEIGSDPNINYVQIFENKGEIMGCSNPHPHGQIWAQRSIPNEVQKKIVNQKTYWEKNKKSLLSDYLKQEIESKERIVMQNDNFVALVPFWAVWPYETMIIPKRHVPSILELRQKEVLDYASILKELTVRYDNLFNTFFPYSMGIHQSPTNNHKSDFWHMHMSFYPPLLRSAEIKKFMVGYEMFAEPQRDITAEQAAEMLRNCSQTHYLKKYK